MWLLNTKREDLVDNLRQSLRGELRKIKRISELSEFPVDVVGLWLVWGETPKEECFLPSLIIVADGEKRDFLAWANTYLPSLHPITHICRVLEYNTFMRLEKRSSADTTKGYLGAAVGLVISEAISNQAVFKRKGELTYRDCLETFSFSFGNALFSGATPEELIGISKSWFRAQKTSRRLNVAMEDIEILLGPWSVLAELCGKIIPRDKRWSNDPDILKVVSALVKSGDVPSRLHKKLAKTLSVSEELLNLAGEGTRESRVVALEKALYTIGNGKGGRSTLATFVASYLVSLLAPGSLEYISLLTPTGEPRTETSLWYGLLGGLHPNTDVFDAAVGLGWNLAIELTRRSSVFDPPSSDLDIDELDMLMDSERKHSMNKAQRAGGLTVELALGSETVVAIGSSIDDKRTVQSDLFDQREAWPNVERVMKDVEGAMRRLDYAKARLEKLANQSSTTPRSSRSNSKTRKY